VKETLLHNLNQLLIALDQVIRVLLALVSNTKGWADETLSAYCWRLYRDGKPWGLWWMPKIDRTFALWQGPDPDVPDDSGALIPEHCRRAYFKEKLRRNLPPEYRTTGPQ
jgi:hypothetical protein